MVIAKSKQTKVDQEVDLCPPPWTPCQFWFFQSFGVATVPTWDVICSRIHLANFDSQIRLLMAPPGSLDFFQKSCIFRITHAWAGCVYGCRHKEKEKTNWYVLVYIYIQQLLKVVSCAGSNILDTPILKHRLETTQDWSVHLTHCV